MELELLLLLVLLPPAPLTVVLVEVGAGDVSEPAPADEVVELETVDDVVDEGVELGDWPVLAVDDGADNSSETGEEVKLREDIVVVPGAVSDSRGTVRLGEVELKSEDGDGVAVVSTEELEEVVKSVVGVGEVIEDVGVVELVSIDELVVELVDDVVSELKDGVLLLVISVEVVVKVGVELGTLDELVLGCEVVGMVTMPVSVGVCASAVTEGVVVPVTSDAGAVPGVVVGDVPFVAAVGVHASVNWEN